MLANHKGGSETTSALLMEWGDYLGTATVGPSRQKPTSAVAQ